MIEDQTSPSAEPERTPTVTSASYEPPRLIAHGELRAIIRGVGTFGSDLSNNCSPPGAIPRGC